MLPSTRFGTRGSAVRSYCLSADESGRPRLVAPQTLTLVRPRHADEVFAEDVPRYHHKNSKGEDAVFGLTLMRKVLMPREKTEDVVA